MTEGELKKMQQEAIRRTREMQRRAAAYSEPAPQPDIPARPDTARTVDPPEPAEPVVGAPEKPPAPARPSAVPKTPETDALGQSVPGGVFEALFRDKEKTLILGLILLLMDEKTDNSLLMALVYLLI